MVEAVPFFTYNFIGKYKKNKQTNNYFSQAKLPFACFLSLSLPEFNTETRFKALLQPPVMCGFELTADSSLSIFNDIQIPAYLI